LIDHYIQPQNTSLPEEMLPYLDYADYDLVIEDSDDEVEQRAPRANRELKSLGIVSKSTLPKGVQKLNTYYNPTYTAHVN
jgi:hypothetical protein